MGGTDVKQELCALMQEDGRSFEEVLYLGC